MNEFLTRTQQRFYDVGKRFFFSNTKQKKKMTNNRNLDTKSKELDNSLGHTYIFEVRPLLHYNK